MKIQKKKLMGQMRVKDHVAACAQTKCETRMSSIRVKSKYTTMLLCF